MKKIDVNRIGSLLIRSTNWIGDAVMTTPAVRAIRENFPQARISLLAKPWVAPVFQHNPHVDDIILYDAKGRHRGATGSIRLAKDLRANSFDAAILLQNAFEAALIVFMAGIPLRIGYNRDARGFLLTHSIPLTDAIRKVHQTGYYLNILSGAGLAAESGPLELYLAPEQKSAAAETLAKCGIAADTPKVGLCPSATFGPAKQWFPNRFAELADRLSVQYGTQTVILGGPGDFLLGEKILNGMHTSAVNLCGRTGLGEAMSLIERCRLIVCNDSGLMHVGAALQVPLIAIFGSTDPVATGPYSPNSQMVRSSLPCSPCLKPECPLGHLDCMQQIEVEMVFRAAEKMLKETVS